MSKFHFDEYTSGMDKGISIGGMLCALFIISGLVVIGLGNLFGLVLWAMGVFSLFVGGLIGFLSDTREDHGHGY